MSTRIGARNMREAYEKGYLGEKLEIQGMTLKVTPEMKERLRIESLVTGTNEQEVIRVILATYFIEADYRFDIEAKARGLTSNLSNSFGTQQKSPSAGTDEPSVQ